MKHFLSVLILLFGFQITAQDADIQSKIDFFNAKIQQTQKGERLKWLDSLTQVVRNKPELKYDSIVRQTIKLAIELDSLSLATNRVVNLIGFYNNYLGKPEEGLKLFNNYLEKLENGADYKAIGRLYLNAADSYYYTGNIDKSFEYYDITKTYAKKAKDQQLLGFATLYIGYNESEMGQFAKASQSLKEAAKIFTKLKDSSNILGAKNGLSILYSKNAFYKEAEKERTEAITIAEKMNKGQILVPLYLNAAMDNKKLGAVIEQIANLKKAIEISSELGTDAFFRPMLLTSLITSYTENDSLDLAENYFKEIETNYLNDKTDKNRTFYVEAKKAILLAKGDYKNAIKYGREHLESRKQKLRYEEIMSAEKFLGNAYKYSNDLNNSNKHFLNYYTFKDSLSNVQNIKSLAYYQTLYETEKRDLEIENQKASIGLLNLQNKNKKQLLIFGSLGLLVLFGGIIFYRSFLNAKKRELAQQEFSQELIKTQEQERTRIAKDLHDGVGQQITLLKMKAQNIGQTELSGLAHNALEEVRSVSKDLYPVTLAKLGLTDSIEQLLLDLDEETDMFVSVEIDDVNTNFNEVESLNLYRFIQESTNNVLKHANAKTLIVNINKKKDGIKILIKDNGQGFEVNEKIKQNSLGLKTMAERISMLNGSFAIKSKRAEGTSVLVQIPV